MATTAQEFLDLVNAAITGLLSGGAIKSYSVGQRTVTKTDLPELFKLRRDLEAEVQAGLTEAEGGGMSTYPEFGPNG